MTLVRGLAFLAPLFCVAAFAGEDASSILAQTKAATAQVRTVELAIYTQWGEIGRAIGNTHYRGDRTAGRYELSTHWVLTRYMGSRRIICDGQTVWRETSLPSGTVMVDRGSPATMERLCGLGLIADPLGLALRWAERFDFTLSGEATLGDGTVCWELTGTLRQPAGSDAEPLSKAQCAGLYVSKGDHLVHALRLLDGEGHQVMLLAFGELRTPVAFGGDTFRYTPPADATVVDRDAEAPVKKK